MAFGFQLLLLVSILCLCIRDLESYHHNWELDEALKHLSKAEQMRVHSMAHSIAQSLRSRPKTHAQIQAEINARSRDIQAEINGEYSNLVKIQHLNKKIGQIQRDNIMMRRQMKLRERELRMNRLRDKFRLRRV